MLKTERKQDGKEQQAVPDGITAAKHAIQLQDMRAKTVLQKKQPGSLTNQDTSAQGVIQRVVIPAESWGGANILDSDNLDFDDHIAHATVQQLLQIIIFMENHPHHNGFDVVYVYQRLWGLLGDDPAAVNPVITNLNQHIPRPIHLSPVAAAPVHDALPLAAPGPEPAAHHVIDIPPYLPAEAEREPALTIHPDPTAVVAAPDHGHHQHAEASDWRSRVTKKGFAGTTFGDISNSIGIGATIASLATTNTSISGSLGIISGFGVGAGGVSQIHNAGPLKTGGAVNKGAAVEKVKGGTNIASGLTGIASGIVNIAGASSAATILGQISGGTWGLAEAVNLVQELNEIRTGDGFDRHYLRALYSALKASAGLLLATGGTGVIPVLASVLGGIGAAGSVITGLHKLYTILKNGDHVDGPDLEVQHPL